MKTEMWKSAALNSRRSFIGGSDVRIIMGNDEAALMRLWREKRGEVEPEDLSRNLIVQLGTVTEELNRAWYEANTGQVGTSMCRSRFKHPTLRWMAATLDGRVQSSWGSIRSQIHVAVVVLGGSRRREICSSVAAQHVGGGGEGRSALGHHRRRQMGGDQDLCRSALPASNPYRRAEVLAVRREWRTAVLVRD